MPNPSDYTIGWICAVLREHVAALSFLDEKHDGLDEQPVNDNNNYTLGRIGKHNVVITALPHWEYGLINAANAARDLVRTFHNVRIGLLVGIGGGVPTKHDIRLGDIVVSSTNYGNGAVFQYDFGKTVQNKKFTTTGFLNKPPLFMMTAVAALEAEYILYGHQLEETIKDTLDKNSRLRRDYERPDASTDRLYRPNVIHSKKDNESCATTCGDDEASLVRRDTRSEDNLVVHYGLIASANRIMEDASVRDELAQEKDVLCFEMEAAGLMDHFPCLVIRGICDYSDTHRNELWQGYAAMVAAAYAKDLLYQIPCSKVEAEKSIKELFSSG
jgi:nucleoside phosphorylase